MHELLTTKEQRVLATLFQINHCSVSRLAKETSLNRTSLYPILEKLLEKGLVTAFTQENTTLYDTIEPAAFKEWLLKQKEQLEQESTELEKWLHKTLSSNRTPSLVSKLRYFEGFDGLKTLYAITDVQAAVETAGEFFRKDYMPKRVAHGVKVKDIMTESNEARHELAVTNQFMREIKMAPGLFKDLGVEINIYDNKTMIAAYDKEKPTGVIIENEKIATAMKNIFEYLWKVTSGS